MSLINAQSPNGPVDFDGYNTTGSTIPAGAAVRITGAATHPDLGYPFPTIVLAQSDDIIVGAGTMPAAGITVGEIADGATGTVRQWGIISEIDTTAFADGDPLYVSDATPGGLVNNPDSPSGITQCVGQVLVSHATAGQIFVFLDPMMDGHVSYTNRGSFEIYKNGTTPVLKLTGSGGSVVVNVTPSGNHVVVLPNVSTTLVGRDTTDFLTGKTFDDLRVLSTGAAFDLFLASNEALTADRRLLISLGDANRTLTISASATVSGTNTGDQTITLTGDVTGSGTGSFATTIANDAVTNAKAANMATSTFKGRATAGTGDPEDLSVASAKTLLNLTGTNSGDQTITLTGDVTGTGTGSFAATIATAAVTMAKMANIASQTVIGRGDASSGVPSALTLETGISVTTGEVFKASGRKLRETLYTSGSGTHTPGADCNFQDVEAWGNGGGGGGADQAGAGQAGAGGGGAAGGKTRKFAAVSGTYAYAIPAAAAGGAAGNNAGATGGDVTFTGTNFTLVAKGGIGGTGGASTTTANVNAGGSGVISTGGDLNGGGANGTQGGVINGASGIAFGGVGGTAEYGRGGGGRTNHGAGIVANGIGNGGGGAVALTTSTPRAGGDAVAGGIRVTEYS